MSRTTDAPADPTGPAGLPGPLPPGEAVLWQGAPSAAAIARRALHARGLAGYFLALGALSIAASWSTGRTLPSATVSVAVIAGAALALLGLAAGFAALVARTTRYTITTRRLVMRIGVAIPITLNIPFGIVAGAGLRTDPDGTGDIPVALSGTGRIAYAALWPHARPWRVSRPEPMLRGVPDAARVAAILARALREAAPGASDAALRAERPAPVPLATARPVAA